MRILKILSSIRFFSAIIIAMSASLVYDTLVNKSDTIAVSPFFALLAVLLLVNLVSCTLSTIVLKRKRAFTFHLIHWGMAALIAGFILSAVYGFEARVFLLKGEKTDIAQDGENLYRLPFKIHLKSFTIEYYRKPRPVITSVLNPSESFPCEPGKIIKTGGRTYKVEAFFSDFVFGEDNKPANRTPFYNNPAALISYREKGILKKVWIFESRAGHSGGFLPLRLSVRDRDIKNFVSEISIIGEKGAAVEGKVSVNSPFFFSGYKIYQTSYDPNMGEASVLTVKKDRWLWLVMSGFAILSAGVLLWII